MGRDGGVRTGMVLGAAGLALAVPALALLRRRAGHEPVRAVTTATINKPPDELYAAWRDLSSLPGFMTHVEAVEPLGGDRWHWVARAPGGGTVEWDAEVVRDQPGRLLSWRSTGGDVAHAGTVTFEPAPADQGTEVTVDLAFTPPAGRAGVAVATLLGEAPGQQVRDDLRRFKQLQETGVVVASDGAPEGFSAARQLTQEPARPGG